MTEVSSCTPLLRLGDDCHYNRRCIRGEYGGYLGHIPWMRQIFPTGSTTPFSEDAMTVSTGSALGSGTSISTNGTFFCLARIRGRLSGLGGSAAMAFRRRGLVVGVTRDGELCLAVDCVAVAFFAALPARLRLTVSAGVRSTSLIFGGVGVEDERGEGGDGASLRDDEDAENSRPPIPAASPRRLSAVNIPSGQWEK